MMLKGDKSPFQLYPINSYWCVPNIRS